jgi:DNA-binding transcriptional regulator LsrR (DeoR family)
MSKNPGAPVRRRTATPPVEFDTDPIVWAAWLYYEERLTQEDVAERLGVSRATVINLLQEARTRDIVSISVAPDYLRGVHLARRLRDRYGLTSALVIPAGDPATASERVGRAGARLVAQGLKPHDVLGVAWGRTVLALATALPALALPTVSVVQIAGSAISTEEFSPEFCTSIIGNRIGARCINLHAPGIVSRPEVKAMLMAEPTLLKQFEIIRSCNKIVFGIAGLDQASLPARSGYLTAEIRQTYLSRGAVGVLAGRFVGRNGAPLLDELDDRMIGMTLDEITRIPERICVAGGAEKREAIAAMLAGNYATTLVTDAAAAEGLLG